MLLTLSSSICEAHRELEYVLSYKDEKKETIVYLYCTEL